LNAEILMQIGYKSVYVTVMGAILGAWR